MQKIESELNKKEKISAIITDLDGTLWSGTLAEKEKITLNKDYYNFLISLYNKGIQLFVVSKNDEKDVQKAMDRLNLEKNKFTAIIANWEPKYLNVEKLIRQTQIRPETVIFIDDNPFERNEVEKKNQAIVCLDAKNWKILEKAKAIKNKENQQEEEIIERINRYKTAINAATLKEQYKEEDKKFLESLKREISIGEIGPENLDRFTRLLIVTHRINFNPDKFKDYNTTLNYLYNRINKGDKLFAVSTKENEVSLGLTGAFVVEIKEKKAIIPDATFSCGIIGRDFEQKSLLELTKILKNQGIKEIEIHVKLTSTNKRVKEILEELSFSIKEKKKDVEIFSVNTTNFKPKKNYEWIKVNADSPEMEYNGFPRVIEFFENKLKKIIKEKFKITNLGSAKGEVLGHLRKDEREKFYEFIKKMKIDYTKIDIEYIPEEKNIIANAENLKGVIENESQDLVIAIELLEHTESFWKVLNEMIRICKKEGYLFITVPSFNFPKHEYPIDLWRIGPQTLKSFFPKPYFKIVEFETEGNPAVPRGCMILVKKIQENSPEIKLPENGKINWETGITIFP